MGPDFDRNDAFGVDMFVRVGSDVREVMILKQFRRLGAPQGLLHGRR